MKSSTEKMLSLRYVKDPRRLVVLLTLALGLPTLLVASGCFGCCDCAYQAINYEGLAGSPVQVTAYRDGEAVPFCEGDLFSCPTDPGKFNLVFTLAGVEVGALDGVCTPGYLSGCEGEDADADGLFPIIEISRPEGVYQFDLKHQGGCPN